MMIFVVIIAVSIYLLIFFWWYTRVPKDTLDYIDALNEEKKRARKVDYFFKGLNYEKEISANEYEIYQEIEKEIEYIFFKNTPIVSYIEKYEDSKSSSEEKSWYYDFHHKHFKNDFADYKKQYIDSLSINFSEYIYNGLAYKKDFIQNIDNFIFDLKSLNSIHENFINAALQYHISNFIVEYGVFESSFPRYFGGLIDSLLKIDAKYYRSLSSPDLDPDDMNDTNYSELRSIYSDYYEEFNFLKLIDLKIYSALANQCFDYFNENYNTELDFYFKNGLSSYYICKNYAYNLHDNREIFFEKYQLAINYLSVPAHLYNSRGRRNFSKIDSIRMIHSNTIFDKLRDELVIPGLDSKKFFDETLEEIMHFHEVEGTFQKGDTILKEEIKKANDKQKIASMLLNLNQIEQKVMCLRFGFDGEYPLTLAEIGKKLNLPVYRVRELEAKTMLKLRKMMENDESNT